MFDSARPELTVIVPVFNERRTIQEILQRVLRAPLEKQVVVVDDGSIDGTQTVLRDLERKSCFSLIIHPENRGKGAAIRSGLRIATGRYVIIQDADLEYSPSNYAELLEPLIDGCADATFGSRYMLPLSKTYRPQWTFRTGVSLLNLAARLLYGVRLTDSSTCYKVMPLELLRSLHLECERFEFCQEVTAKLCRIGARIVEVPIGYRPRFKASPSLPHCVLTRNT